MNSAHGYDTKQFPLSSGQGRLLYHLERLFRSTGAGAREHRAFIAACARQGLDVGNVAHWTIVQCVTGLQLLEAAARPMALFRDIRTGWKDFAPGGRFARGQP